MKPIGLDLPLRRGRQGGFQQTFTTQDAIKSNIKNFLLTNFGERPLNPTFGNNLRNFVFEQDVEETKIQVEELVRTLLSENFPSIQIENFVFEDVNDDNRISFSLTFSLVQYPSLLERITLDLKIGN
jgi:phage baseplate assembly protein W